MGKITADIAKLLNPCSDLSKQNKALHQFLIQELGAEDSWFRNFKKFRDNEATHRKRAPRLIKVGKPEHDIEIDDEKVAEFSVKSLSAINRIIEEAYRLM